uniref:Pentatricopeptide repeat-containing protein n=1 Tax=Arundo donax TaxID=35708 RepID=A0A0A9DU81_ARUDO
MITGYVAAGEFDEAQKFFDDMLVRGQLPNVYTYNSMIRGLCTVGKFDKAILYAEGHGFAWMHTKLFSL